jgi:hypothetical protein
MFKIISVSLAAVLMLISTPTFAGNCGGHCQQGKVCVSQGRPSTFPKIKQHAEYNKCMTDPHNYK